MIERCKSNFNGKNSGNAELLFLEEQLEWVRCSTDLSKWFLDNYFVRHDAHGQYGPKGNSWCEKTPITRGKLRQHCGGVLTVGTYTTDPADDCGKTVHIDIDLHDGQPGSPLANQNYAKVVYQRCLLNGLAPLLTDSNGKGGCHLTCFFQDKVPAAALRSLGRWLVRDHADFGVRQEPEVFPKQDRVAEGGYGNMFRLPGKHHKRDWFSKAWDGKVWLAGGRACRHVMGIVPAAAAAIPKKAVDYLPPAPTRKEDYRPSDWKGEYKTGGGWEWLRNYGGDMTTLDLVGLFQSEDRLLKEGWPSQVLCPWSSGHSTGDGGTYLLESDNGWHSFYCHHASCRGKGLEDALAFFGKEKVDAHCGKKFERPSDDTCTPEEFEQKYEELYGKGVPEVAVVDDLEKYRSDPRTAYLWRGIHERHVDDEGRRRRIRSIEDAWQYIPPTGFFPAYIKHWLPTTDASVLFHLGTALALAGVFAHRKVWITAGATEVKPIF